MKVLEEQCSILLRSTNLKILNYSGKICPLYGHSRKQL